MTRRGSGRTDEVARRYTRFYERSSLDNVYPSEYVIRVFRGTYPRLALGREQLAGRSVLDVGCGDGRNLLLLHGLGMRCAGSEITEGIRTATATALGARGVDADIRVGTNAALPWEDAAFDFLLSWNSSYYLGPGGRDYREHVREFRRVLAPAGRLVLSVPQPTSFIFERSTQVGPGVRRVDEDPFGIRVGELMRCFETEAEIEEEFAPAFGGWSFATITDDCFGLANHWFVGVATAQG